MGGTMEYTTISDKDGIVIKSDIENNRYIVEMPNSYDIYWRFNDKNLAERLPVDDKRIAVFAIPLDKLDNKGLDKFDEKIDEARKVYRDTKAEKADFEDVIGFDQAHDGKTVTFVYKNPPKGYCIGEVLKTGTYFVAQKSGEDDERVYVRMIHTNRFLNGKADFENREQVIAEKFPIGSVKYLSYGANGKIHPTDYDSNKKREVETDELVKKITEREQIAKPQEKELTLEQKKNLYLSQKM